MAMPDLKNPHQKIYLVRIKMSSQNQVSGSKRIDPFTRELKYKNHEDIRKDIAAIRQSVHIRREFSSTPFYGVYFTNEVGMQQLTDVCQKADREMKEIDPSLHVTASFIKQNFSDSENISAFDELIGAIRGNILNTVMERIKVEIDKNKDHLTEKTRAALCTMLDQCKPLNLTGDPAIDAEIEQMRARINANQLRELRDDILVITDSLRDRGSSLELVDDIKTNKPAPAPKPILPDNGSRVLDIL
jgi:hypothetical protein